MFDKETVINHREITQEEATMVLFFTIGKIKAFLDADLRGTKYHGKFDVRFIEDGMAGDYIDIVYLKLNLDIEKKLCFFQIIPYFPNKHIEIIQTLFINFKCN